MPPKPDKEPVLLGICDRFDNGSFADIFNSKRQGRIYKLFKRYDYDDQLPDRSEDRVMLRRAVCSSEIEAYLKVNESPFLAKHTPRFFGHRFVHGVVDDNDQDVSSRYLLDCCYEIAFVEGRAEKLFSIQERPPYVDAVLEEFGRFGVAYVKDSSVFNLHDPDRFCIIDFGVEDRHEQLDIEIGLGGLSNKHRGRWSNPLSF